MASLDHASLSNESTPTGWWIAASFAGVGLMFLFAALIHQAAKLSETFNTLMGERSTPTAELASENLSADSDQKAETDIENVPSDVAAVVTEPLTDESVAAESIEPAEPVDSIEKSLSADTVVSAQLAETDSQPSEASDAELPAVETNGPESLTELPVVETNDPELLSDETVENAPVANEALPSTPLPDVNPADSSLTESQLALASLRENVLEEMTDRSHRIRFEIGSSELTPNSVLLLGQTFEDLFLYAESDIVIEVSSLDATEDASNESLSNTRAQAIRTFLIDRGIESERLVISLLPDSAELDDQQYVNIQANL